MRTIKIPESEKMEIDEDEKRYANSIATKLNELANNLHQSIQNAHTLSKRDFLTRVGDMNVLLKDITDYFVVLSTEASKA